jgi:predicted metal-binding membrane protein
MSSATVRRGTSLPGAIELSLIALLLVLAALAWAITGDQMSGMDAGPGTDPGSLGFFLGVWVVMMAAMMFPSIVPMVLTQVRLQGGLREQGESVARGTTTLFVAGYLVTWAAAGLVGYGIYELGKALTADVFAWDDAGPYLAGGIVVAAAVYQLTPLRDVCLRHCRSPLMFLLHRWRAGRWGALRMGIVHGAWCVGCCWMLMAALFALGVMSLGWMALIAALIAIEKLLLWKVAATRGIVVLLLVLGLGVAFSAENVPGLTLPNSPAAARAMHSMGMDNGSMSHGHTSGDATPDESMRGNGSGTGMHNSQIP